MTLTDPRNALADQSSFVDYLVGVAGLARVVRALGTEGEHRESPPREADDFVHVLLGVASLGEAIDRLAESAPAQQNPRAGAPSAESTTTRWLR